MAAPLHHHVLCPSHPDFSDSGAKEKLERIRSNATQNACDACSFHLKNGRRNKGLAHGSRCDFSVHGQSLLNASSVTNVSAKRSHDASNGGGLDGATADPSKAIVGASAKELRRHGADGGEQDDARQLTKGYPFQAKSKEDRRRQGAEGGCAKCIEEIRTGKKELTRHAPNCPLSTSKPANMPKLRRQGAQGGCLKCKEELRTGKKINSRHSNTCPLSKSKDTVDISDPRRQGAEGGCGKCRDELRTGRKERHKHHREACPLFGGRKSEQKSETRDKDGEENLNGFDRKSSSVARNELASGKPASGKSTLWSRQAYSQVVAKETDENPEDESTILESHWVTPSPKPQPAEQDSSFGEQMEWDSEDDESVTLWEQCGNPWGDIGQNEDDHVLISPYGGLDSPLKAITGLAVPRFNSNPFVEGSPYVQTHHLPSMGIRVLKLTRDVIAMRPWGLTVKRHEFGGACLVSVVDPISPAAAAEDIGGAVSSGSNSRGLHLNDMILYANSKPVGDMTEDDLAVEMEICGSELLLVVSEYNGCPLEGPALDNNDEDAANTWRELDKGAFDWQEIGPGSRTRATPEANAVYGSSMAGGMPEAPETTAAPVDSHQRQVTFLDDGNKARHLTVDGEDGKTEHHESSFAAETADDEHQKVASFDTDIDGMPLVSSEPMQISSNFSDMEQDAEAPAGPSNEADHVHENHHDASALHVQESDQVLMDYTSEPVDSPEEGSYYNEAPGLGIDQIIADFSIPKTTRNGKRHDEEKPSTIDATLSKSNEEEEDEDDEEYEPSPAKLEQGSPGTRSVGDGEGKDEGWDDEDNEDDPILGCICGETHEEPVQVFWLQCDLCQAWYNNSVKCVGFDEEMAQKMDAWVCVSCGGEQPKVVLAKERREEQTAVKVADTENYISAGSRVLVQCAQSRFKGTVRKHRTNGIKNGVEYLIHFDGNKMRTMTWTPSIQIHSLVTDEGKQVTNRDEEEECRIQAFEQPKVTSTTAAARIQFDSQGSEEKMPSTDSEVASSRGYGKNLHKEDEIGIDSQVSGQSPPELEPKKKHEADTASKKKRSKTPIRFEKIEEVDPDMIEFSCSGRIEKRRIDRDHKTISVGSLVRVADRSAISGPTRQGGVAKVTGRRGSLAEGNLVYDVRYMVVNGRESDVSWTYVVLDEAFEDSQSHSRAGGSRRSRSKRVEKDL